MQHNTVCNLDFNENLLLMNLKNDVDYLRLWVNDIYQKHSVQPETMAKTLASIMDKIDTIKEHKKIIYPVFEKFDNLSSNVRRLPK